MKINFITNQDINSISGGWSGISYNVHDQLQKHYTTNYIESIYPSSSIIEKSFSKLFRVLGERGNFHFFSERRLEKIKNEVNNYLSASDYNYFFGQTPWIKIHRDTPYGVYKDADF